MSDLLRVEIDDHGAVADLQQRIAKLTATLEGAARERVLRAAADELREVERELFDSGGATGRHGKWPAYTPAEARWRAFRLRVGMGDTPMKTPAQALERSLTTAHGHGHIERIRGEMLTFGTSHPATRRKRLSRPFRRRGYSDDVPLRRVIDLTAAQVDRVEAAVIHKWRREMDRVAPPEWGKA